ncbi:RNAPII degradation factor [Malassezia vespertilionis]|uniref:RNA polymerase II degradation factor 1 n=1 Tax=Malassezia vespertilionis TaxID=2020962 RepID=A0A2N1J9G6_9BASI|nr:RNAPII degradation factor [Malassezia vespertilionis]PKI83200.1 hypothetical protein MVES_003075 [Malassezia vespertilionis]WFD07868.1 RNAPII degradation factor [Malassezia vespertilionis]
MSTPPSGAARRAPNSRRRATARGRANNASTANDTEQVRELRTKYAGQLAMLLEMFPEWTDEDLLFVLQESSGVVEVAVGRISEGQAEQFASVKSKRQTRKEAAASAPALLPVPTTPQPAPVAAVPAPVAQAPRARAARTERGTARGRGASTQGVRGRGGFRGVGTRASVGMKPAAVDATPVTTTSAAFSLSDASKSTDAAEKPQGMSWAQIARPPVPKRAPEPTLPLEQSTAEAAPPIDAHITQSALALDAQVNADQAPMPAPAPPPQVPFESAAARVRPQRARQDAAVVMPGGASALDRLGMQFGNLNFMASDDPSEESPAALQERFSEMSAPKHDAAQQEAYGAQPSFDAFKSNAFSTNRSYALASNARPLGLEQAQADEASAQQAQNAYSSIYGNLHTNQKSNLYYGQPANASVALNQRGEERSAAHAAPQHAGPQHAAPPEHEGHAGLAPNMQQHYPNVMPYYYPYYMPNQFQHYASHAAGFGQYPMYGGQPQHPSKPEQPPTAPQLSSPYAPHLPPTADTAGVPYGTHTPPQHFQTQAVGGNNHSYDVQGFAQRMPNLGAANDFKLQSADANASGIPGLSGFLGGSQANTAQPQRAANASSAPAASSPLDYRSFDAKSPSGAGRAQAAGAPPGISSAQPATAAQQSQHPAYYQQHAQGLGQNAYGAYPYGRQQYWG